MVVNRKVLRKAMRKFSKMVEKESGTPVPSDLRRYIAGIASSQLRGKSREELPRILLENIKGYPERMKNFDNLSIGLDEDSKAMIDRLAEKLDDNKNVFLTILKHMPVINYFMRISEDLEKGSFESLKKDIRVFLISYLYLAFYELAEELLFDIALEISKRNTDDLSLNLMKAHQRKPYQRGALLNFLVKGGYFENKRGAFFEDMSNLRDKIAHLLVYFDSDRDKINFDGKYVDSAIIIEKFEKLFKFFCYLIRVFSKNPALLNHLKNMETQLQVITKKNLSYK